MAIVSVERHALSAYDNGEKYIVHPKPPHVRGRVTVYVPDEVVREKQHQPVINAYAGAVNKPDMIGKTAKQLEDEHDLMLGFHVTHFDDGADAKEWVESQRRLAAQRSNGK